MMYPAPPDVKRTKKEKCRTECNNCYTLCDVSIFSLQLAICNFSYRLVRRFDFNDPAGEAGFFGGEGDFVAFV